jgi:uncharacterized protein YhbP (UPF0306 family)
VAIAVFDSRQSWGKPDRGVQLWGSAREARGTTGRAAEQIYSERFASYAATDLSAYRLYLFRPRRLKLFDERELGAGTFVTARVTREGRLAWVRTDIYRGDLA